MDSGPERYSFEGKKGGQGSDMTTMAAQDATSMQLYRKDHTRRKLKARHVQLLGIGGVIGTLTFVGIGKTLLVCGPGSLLIAFLFW